MQDNYITDKEMIDLGFKKVKSFKKKQTGISSFCWMLSNGFTLSIEKMDNDDTFVPVLRIQKFIMPFYNTVDLIKVLQPYGFLEIENINNIYKNQLAGIIFSDGQPFRAINNYLLEVMELLNGYKCVLNEINIISDDCIEEKYIKMNDKIFIDALEHLVKSYKELD